MARTDSDKVKATLLADYKEGHALTQFIADASLVVDELVAADATLGAAKLEAIERYVACHLYVSSYRSLKQKQTKSSSGTFDGNTGMGFKATLYGQNALLLDTTGFLADMDQTAESGGSTEVGITWLGKPASAQIDHEDRN